MSAIDWEHAPEIAKPTYEELEAMCWELTEQNAELREHVKMPDEPLEIDEKDFYVRAFIKWAIEEQPEVKRLEAENEQLRELAVLNWEWAHSCCGYNCKMRTNDCGYQIDRECNYEREIWDRMRELGVEV